MVVSLCDAKVVKIACLELKLGPGPGIPGNCSTVDLSMAMQTVCFLNSGISLTK